MKKSSTLLVAALAFAGGGILAFTIAGKGTINNVIKGKGLPELPVITVPSEEMVSRSYDVSGFTGIEISLPGTLEIEQGNVFLVEASVPENMTNLVEVTVRGNTLVLSLDKKAWMAGDRIKMTVTMPDLESLEINGFGDVRFSGFELDSFDLSVAGAAKITGTDGRCEEASIESSGAAEINFQEFVTRNARVEVSGAADVKLTMGGGDLTGSISGAASVVYGGDIRSNNVELSGVGSVKRR